MKTGKLSRLTTVGAAAVVAMLVGLTSSTSAQCMEQQKLTASDAAMGDYFGSSVSVSGQTALVGAWRDGCAAGDSCGSAYVYRFNGAIWVEEQKLTASDAAAGDHFGISVSISKNTAIVGARWNDCTVGSHCGSAYVFRFNGTSWVEEQKLTASDPARLDQFGGSVSVSGNIVVVGAHVADCSAGNDCGAAYVFRFNGTDWVEEQKLSASDAAPFNWFGFSVSVSGDTAVVGAWFNDCAAGNDCGAAYVFRFNGTSWVEEQKLTASDPARRDQFGGSVSVSGNIVVVGAHVADCSAGNDCGAAYVFRFNGTDWVEEQKLTASDAGGGDNFSRAVSVSGATVVVGAWFDDCEIGEDCGSVYIFRFNGTSWVQEQKLTSSDASAGDQFGVSVSVSGDTAMVGAGLANCTADDGCGSVYVFSCPTVAKLDIRPGSCPNQVIPRSQGVVPVALVGSLHFDVAAVDPDSLILIRSDGVGGHVLPLSDRHGPEIVIEDLVSPLGDEPCSCHELGGDGMDDLSLKFSTSEMNRALELSALPRGATIELVLQGSSQDGTTFEATDCIVISETVQCTEQRKLTASDATAGDQFGYSVSVSGDTAVVGAYGDECAAGFRCGSAYVFRFDGTDWVEEQKLTASDAGAGDHFGISVAVNGDTTVVGAPRNDCATGVWCGSAYVFRFDGISWVEEQKLTASDAGLRNFFGVSVSVNADTAVVGAFRGNCAAAGGTCGSAYAFRFDGTSWVEEQKLTASDAASNDGFGWSVSVSGDTAVVVASAAECSPGSNCGSAYVFRFNGSSWVEEQKLTASDAATTESYRWSVSMSGDTIAVGARIVHCAPGMGTGCGAMYVFRFDGTSWVEEQKLAVFDADAGTIYMVYVSVSGNMALVGARFFDSAPCAGSVCGAVYVFRFNGTSWFEEQKLTASKTAQGDHFGSSVSVCGDTAMVGVTGNPCLEGDDCGAAYVFSCTVAPIIASLDIKPGSCPNPVNPRSQGVVPVILVGSFELDVAVVDTDSLVLARVDGVGGSVSPLFGRRGLGIAIQDMAVPFDGEPEKRCACHVLGGDGMDDLSLKFSTSEMSRAFELNALSRGEIVELVLRGTLLDGTTFEATDCIVIPGRQGNLRGILRTGK